MHSAQGQSKSRLRLNLITSEDSRSLGVRCLATAFPTVASTLISMCQKALLSDGVRGADEKDSAASSSSRASTNPQMHGRHNGYPAAIRKSRSCSCSHTAHFNLA